MELGPRKKAICILQRTCGSQTILTRSCLPSDNITKEGDILFSFGRLTGVWEGRRNRNRACVKVLRVHTADRLSGTKQRLFKEIVIWRRLSHPGILPALGVSPRLFPTYVIIEWMINGNTMEFTLVHPEVNRLRLLAEAASGLQYLHSISITHKYLKSGNILIDRHCRPRLTDYGLPLRLDFLEEVFHRDDDQCLALELLDPSSIGVKNRVPTKENDIFAFGTIIYEVLTEQQPFHAVKYSIIDSVATGARPLRPTGPNDWLSDDIWNLVTKCWSPSWDNRPDLNAVTNGLDDAGDSVELRNRGLEEADLTSFLNDCRDVPKDAKKAKALWLTDLLDVALDDGDLHKRKRKKCLRYLRKLCGTFGILPSSFILELAFDERGTEPFATGGFSYVYKATINGRPVAVKTLRVPTTADPKKVHKLLVKEVVGWKWLTHNNILPFVGVTLASPVLSIISERMENGNIIEFIKAHPKYNRLRLLIDVLTGLEYLHKHDVVHGDLKGANVLIDSECRGRLADFGLTVVIDESTTGSTTHHRGMRGTVRWMAPEVMYPEKFGFDGEYRKRLPSRSTDIYALGMTILEVITGRAPFDSIHTEMAVICKVLEGDRPDRPPSGFSDQLWELLVATWCVEHGSQPSKRPSTSIILGRLNEDVDKWEKSIIPPALVQKAESTGRVSSRFEDDGSDDSPMITVVHPNPPFDIHSSQGDLQKSSQRSPRSFRILDTVVRFLGLGLLGRLLRFLFNPSPSG